MTAQFVISELKKVLPESTTIVRGCFNGYGKTLLKSAFNLYEGMAEAIAHCSAASFFDMEVDCVLGIGVQDTKCIKLMLSTARSKVDIE